MSESKTQDPKYIIIDGVLANASTRQVIPEDEPVFIIRAQDVWAAETLIVYRDLCENPAHQQAVDNRIMDFCDFAENKPERMKEPDTEVSSGD